MNIEYKTIHWWYFIKKHKDKLNGYYILDSVHGTKHSKGLIINDKQIGYWLTFNPYNTDKITTKKYIII